jgi:hypothetical protein
MNRLCVIVAAAVALAAAPPAAAQSAFTLCADTLPNRIISTGPVRAVVATMDTLRVCLAVEGFSDSAAVHPRDWRRADHLVVLETRYGTDVRRLQESRVLTTWTKNERALAIDSLGIAWRSAAVDLIAAKWDAAARRMEQHELEQNIADVLAQQAWIRAQIDTVKHKDDSLRLAVSEGVARARFERQRTISAAQKYESAARSQLSRAQSALASASASGDAGRIQSARSAVASAEASVRAASERVQAAQSSSPDTGVGAAQDLLDRLDAKGRTATLTAMLMDLDADNRAASWRGALDAIRAQPDPEVRLLDAAARLKAILAR